jgi:hypothetical protein
VTRRSGIAAALMNALGNARRNGPVDVKMLGRSVAGQAWMAVRERTMALLGLRALGICPARSGMSV